MATREEFLDLVWEDINRPMQEHWIENVIRTLDRDPKGPFTEVGSALKRLLALGASRRDLSLIYRLACYEEAFALLYQLDDPGIDDNEVEGLHDSLLGADPSGQEGRPGSAPPLKGASSLKSGRNKKKSQVTTMPEPGKRKLLKKSEAVCFSPDGTMLATLGRGLTLWKCPEIELLAKISTFSNPCYLAFSPQSRFLALKNTSGRIVLIEPSTQTTTRDFRNQADGEGSNVVFSDDGKHVVDASWKGVHFVRTIEGKITFREVFQGDMVTAVLRHPDGRYWFRHKRPDERLIGRTWPFAEGEFEKVTVPLDRYLHSAFSPDGRLLTLSNSDAGFVVRVFSFPDMETLNAVQLPSLGAGTNPTLRFSPCGRLLAVVGGKSQAVLNSKTLSVIEEISIEYGCDVDFSPTDPLMAVGSWSVGEVLDTTPYLRASGDQGSPGGDGTEKETPRP